MTKILNLVYPDKSDIKYQIQRFPDGQQNVVILHKESEIEYWKHHDPMYKTRGVEIKSRLNNWLDLELISCSIACLKELGVEEIHLYVPYIMGARSDRKFEEGGNNYIKDVIAPVINYLNFKSVTCIDPHSDVLEACIKGFKKESNLDLVKYCLNELVDKRVKSGKSTYLSDCILISPDAGANKKIYKLAEQIGYKGDIITCSKDRDKDGKLTKVNIPIKNDVISFQKDKIIIDDICDGGATFINIAKELKNLKHDGKIYLIVTHGIFSNGHRILLEYFDGIYCTNSYKDITLKDDYDSERIKQLNVF